MVGEDEARLGSSPAGQSKPLGAPTVAIIVIEGRGVSHQHKLQGGAPRTYPYVVP